MGPKKSGGGAKGGASKGEASDDAKGGKQSKGGSAVKDQSHPFRCSKKDSTTPTMSALGRGSAGTSRVYTSTGNHDWIVTEIRAMMHGFGDSRHPLLESVKLTHEILRQQMNQLLLQTSRTAQIRSSRFIGLEDILLLMTKDRVKLARLIHYLSIKDLKNSALQSAGGTDDREDDLTAASEVKNEDAFSSLCPKNKRKRKKLCEDFLSTIDQTGELMSIFDAPPEDIVKGERNLRVDCQSRQMGSAEYLDFAEARQASFRRRYKGNRFREWLLKDKVCELAPNAMALEIFSYLAYETVAQIVDLALLVKQDADTNRADVSSRGAAHLSYNQDYPMVRVPARVEPPASDSSDRSGSPSSQTPSSSASSSTGAIFAPKAKKRKMSGPHSDYVIPIHHCIQPVDIQEAMRRYYQQAGPMAPLSKVHAPQLGRKLLCC